MSVTVTLDTHKLDALINGWDDLMSAVVRKTAADVLAGAQQNIRRNGQIKTGHMLNSGHVEPGENATTMYVVFSATYSIFQELGTRFMRGRPFLVPSVEQHRHSLQDDLSSLLGSLVER